MKVSSALRWLATSVCALIIVTTQADNCGVRTGIAQPTDGYEINWHNRLAGEIAQKDAPNAGTDLIFYGDSLTELWRGTAWGYTGHLGYGIPDVFRQYFGKYNTEICGSAGDTSSNLWWRIDNGELPRNHAPKVAVVWIGANDLSGAFVNCGTWDESDYNNAASSIAQQIGGIAGTIHASFASTRVIVMGMLPRGTDYWDGGSSRTSWPNPLTPAIDALNNELQQLDYNTPGVTYLYCGSGFTTSSGLNMDYLQDGQHPSVEGYQAVARCLQPVVASYLGSSNSAGGDAGSTTRDINS